MGKSIDDLTKKQRRKRDAIMRSLGEAKQQLPRLTSQAELVNGRLKAMQTQHATASDQLLNFDRVHGIVGQGDA